MPLSIPTHLAWTLYSCASQTLWVLPHLRPLCSLALAMAPLPRASRLFQAPAFCRLFFFRFHFQWQLFWDASHYLPRWAEQCYPQRTTSQSLKAVTMILHRGGRDFPRRSQYFETCRLTLIIKVSQNDHREKKAGESEHDRAEVRETQSHETKASRWPPG